ncbi:STAS domain-containing protein [Fastidiosibacter lacustris]|uniref:STAS domain-containing protein n=1 Tax=Fastidiosibacter lacustris TaxID=2056695 RepID=UPI000E3549DA|nr:STAS domain-containing protein [Fastidiosibacter lacustris]
MSLLIKSPDSWQLSGILTVTNVSEIEKKITCTFKNFVSNVLIIDLANITQIDSAGIALLLKIIHLCRKKNIKLLFKNFMLENAQSLIKVHNLDKLFQPFLAQPI